MTNIEKFEYTKYGETACSRCSKPLYKCHVVARDDDEEGHRWRMFCDDCWNKISHRPIKEIYATNKIAEIL